MTAYEELFDEVRVRPGERLAVNRSLDAEGRVFLWICVWVGFRGRDRIITPMNAATASLEDQAVELLSRLRRKRRV